MKMLDKMTMIKTLLHNWHIPSGFPNKPGRVFLVSSVRAILSFHIMPFDVTTCNNHEPSHWIQFHKLFFSRDLENNHIRQVSTGSVKVQTEQL